MEKQTLIENLEYALTHHDWHYGYSDDTRSYWAGKETEARIRLTMSALEAVDKELADELYAKYRPKDASY